MMYLHSVSVLSFLNLREANSIFLKPHSFIRCSRKNGENNGLSGRYLDMELKGQCDTENSQETKKLMTIFQEKKPNDVWELFKEAQQNILQLNKQRMMAMEELEKTKAENKFLLDRIEELEKKRQPGYEKDRISISSELLLRIDSWVLTGMIGTGEASDLRRMITNSGASIADDISDNLQSSDAELLAELRRFSAKSKREGLHIVHICTEMAPVISVGKLASYVTGLSNALQRKGHLVEVILPKYSILNLDEVQGLREIEAEFYSFFNGGLHINRVWTGVVCGIGVTFIQPIYHSSFFSYERVYGYADDFERFAYFSRAALDYIIKSGKQPDVLQIHNWQTAIVAPLFWDVFVQQGLGRTRILLTIHDFDSQCVEQPDKLALCGLDPSRLHRPDRLQDNMKTRFINILKGGIVYSNKVVAMSATHLKSSFTRNLSHGLEPTIAVHKDKLLVSPYGIDKFTWDPSTDQILPQKYSAKDMKGKAVCKRALQEYMSLSENAHIVLVGCIFSEVTDIDLDNLKSLASIASRKGVQFIFMGNKISRMNRTLESFQKELKDDNVRFLREYDEELTHLFFAGSDIILCHSFDEPELQVPLKAIRYGACPVAATIIDNQSGHTKYHDLESTKFSQYVSSVFGNLSLSQAIDEINSNRTQWNSKIIDAMTKDFSWDAECCDVHESAYRDIKNL